MLEKPNLSDEKIIACVQDCYGVSVANLEFLPIGNDATAWAYKIYTDEGQHYFLKVKRGQVSPAMVAVPRYLNDCGIEQIVAPLSPVHPRHPVHPGDLWVEVDGFRLIVYPFIDGVNGMEAGMSDELWTELGSILKKIHAIQPPNSLLTHIPKESFVPKWDNIVRELHAQIPHTAYDDPLEQRVAEFWLSKYNDIEHILARTSELGRLVQTRAPQFILCHADIHVYNLLIDDARKLFIVDWDEVIMAPKERDLMFIGGGGADKFYEGYYGSDNMTDRERDFDPTMLAYYRYEWVVQELGDYGERILLMTDIGQKTKLHAAEEFCDLFQPGDVVDGAYNSDCA